MTVEVIWEPQPGPQTKLLTCPVFEVFFGGARGGGKTDGMLGEWVSHAAEFGEHAVGRIFRRERTQLLETIERSKQLYAPLGAVWKETEKVWTFPNGARFAFSYLDSDGDAEAYQGHSYTRVYFEELGNFPDPKPVMKLMATLRSAQGVPPGFRSTGNPGGPGHNWVRTRYIDPWPAGYKVIKDDKTGLERVYIPSKVFDNRKLLDGDPTYLQRLRMSGSDALVRAWLEGDWSVVDGAYFECWSTERHVVRPFEIPAHWLRFRAMDWGSAAPFAVGWFAVAGEDHVLPDRVIPKGALVMYREWYGASEPNVGLKLTAEDVAKGIEERERGDKVAYGVIDPSAFAQNGGPSIAERMMACTRGQNWRRADNTRTGEKGALTGWDQVRARLMGDGDGRAMLHVFHTCKDLIRTLPVLQHDPDRPEDVDTDGEDHAADMLRYACAARPWTKTLPKQPEPGRSIGQMSLDELYALTRHGKGRRI